MMGAALLVSPSASAVDYTWFSGTIWPVATRTEGNLSWSFLRTSSNADSGLPGNPHTRMTCRLGAYSAAGGETCSISRSSLNNDRASFTYEHLVGNQQANARAWIGGIPPGGMHSIPSSPLNDVAVASAVRAMDGEWSVTEQALEGGNIRVSLSNGDVSAKTTTTDEAYHSRGISLAVEGEGMKKSIIVFPENSTLSLSSHGMESLPVNALAPGVYERTDGGEDPVFITRPIEGTAHTEGEILLY